ncbi:MAG: hypothetical protein R2857_15740 [Vampirovibrionales bacterium]
MPGVQAMFRIPVAGLLERITAGGQDHRPQVYYVDNVDPGKLSGLLNVLDLKRPWWW